MLSELAQEAAAILAALSGPQIALMEDAARLAGRLVLSSRALSIAGGTSEIKRNQIGETTARPAPRSADEIASWSLRRVCQVDGRIHVTLLVHCVFVGARWDMVEAVATSQSRHRRVRVPKMAELVAQQLRRQIIRGELPEGAALPSEAALMTRFGVSRPTLREAFRVLESEGLINVRRGAHGGARVQVPNGEAAARYAGLVLEFRGATLQDVYEARGVLEPPCARRLASRRTKADIDTLRENIARTRAAIDDPAHAHPAQQRVPRHDDRDGREPDDHRAEQHGAADHRPVELPARRRGRRHAGATSRRPRRASARTQMLVDYIEAKDPDQAESMWRKHLTEAQYYMLGGGDPKTVLDLLG